MGGGAKHGLAPQAGFGPRAVGIVQPGAGAHSVLDAGPACARPHLVFAGFDKDAKRAEKGKYFIHLFLQTFQLAL